MPKACHQVHRWSSPKYQDFCMCQETFFRTYLIRLLRTQESQIYVGTRQREREREKKVSMLLTGVIYQIAVNHN